LYGFKEVAMHTMSFDISTLEADLARTPAGSLVHLSLLTKEAPTSEQIRELSAALQASGASVVQHPTAGVIQWDGNEIPAIDLSFVNPGTPAAGTVGFLPMLILVFVAIGAAGYLVWKAGEIAEDSAQAFMKRLPWILGIVGVIYLVSKKMQPEPARR
jgi:hypothetical protein